MQTEKKKKILPNLQLITNDKDEGRASLYILVVN